ncbi:hypothetical protein G6M89_08110 [Natronolimnobius sp. AArcel1]|uniref:hypothetical protein n=1 Tax=Natronolimnobius sp. AArcel1 TaxID=1679093 RepID=UPI0013EBAE95|nr:hypothetical protein [Natronolimnobius sp. AArcel1]NGM68976.1 hypothetical protein [Natronolimnobius sp. AArcel1]
MASQPVLSSDHGETNRTSVAASAGLGVVTAAVGYLLTALLIAGEVSDGAGEEVADWKGIAWYYYNGHMVDISGSGSIGGFSSSDTVNFLAESSSTSATLVYVVPPIVLLATGAALAYHFGTRDIGSAVLIGAPVTIGYAVVMGLGTLVTEASGEWSAFGIDATASMAPETMPAIVLAGLLYPLVFATAGAVLTAVLRS